MKSFVRTTLAVVVCTLAGSSAAFAQATRTWVSGVGDDANPCSRTAPCKTFAGAISKTATNGEINVIDPGGFGGVTITKSITINGDPVMAGVLVSGTNGIIINGAGIVVRLKHLHLNGLTTGLAGIKILNAAAVIVDDVFITGFQTGIDSAVGTTTVRNAVISVSTYYGVISKGSSSFSLEDSLLTNNNIAIQADDVSTMRLSNNAIYNNLTGFGCGGGTLVSAGNNRKAGNAGGTGPACVPTVVLTVQ